MTDGSYYDSIGQRMTSRTVWLLDVSLEVCWEQKLDHKRRRLAVGALRLLVLRLIII